MRLNPTFLCSLVAAAFVADLASAQGVCGAPNGNDCCLPSIDPGCSDAACCQSVCAADSFCCDSQWDQLCADAAAKACAVCSDPCGAPNGNSCCTANGAPGCSDETCCASICAADPFCCNTQWDQLCANAALKSCASCVTCGSPSTGDCCEQQPGPYCNDATCCQSVCAADPFCCGVQWDFLCANAAVSSCGICGDPCNGADLNNDGFTDGADLATVLGAWGTLLGDVDGDGITGGSDLAAVLAAWGPCGTPQVPSWATLLESYPDPAVVTDAALRAAIIETGYAWRVRDNATQIEMLLIPPGTFNMGCSPSNEFACAPDENPVHAVTLTNAFYTGRYEVTQAQWTAKMGSNPSSFHSPNAEVPAAQVPNRPVETVSWNQVQGFLAASGLRLPTEAEWEYAYRAGTTTAYHSMPGYPNGTNDASLAGIIGWQTVNFAGYTRPVGLKAANGFGLHDMLGNVEEWVNDWYSDAYYASSPSINPPGPASGVHRAARGGGWLGSTYFVRASSRTNVAPTFWSSGFGFRVARNP